MLNIAPSREDRGWELVALDTASAQLVRRAPGFRLLPPGSGRGQRHFAPFTPGAAAAVLDLVAHPSANHTPEAIRLAEDLVRRHMRAQELLRENTNTRRQTPTGETIWPHQVQALRAMEQLGYRALLADDMGLGKTMESIMAAYDATAMGHCERRVLVACPAFLLRNWKHELAKFIGDEMGPVHLIMGDKRKKADAIAKLRGKGEGGWAIINYEALPHLSEDQLQLLRDWVMTGMAIFDESHYLKSIDAQRTKIAHLKLRGECNLLLTGTPVRNLHVDLYSQIMLIEPKAWRGPSEFDKRYCTYRDIVVGRRKVRKLVSAKNMEHLNRVVNFYKLRRTKSEVIDLPPKTKQVVELELDGKSARLYQSMKRYWMYEFANVDDSENIFSPRAKSAIESALRMEQICQGFIGGVPDKLRESIAKGVARKDMELTAKHRKGEYVLLHGAKLNWLLETLETMRLGKRRCAVFFRFNGPLHYLARVLGERAVALHGALRPEEKAQAIDDFQDGKGDVFLCQVQMGTGFNLVTCQDAIFYGRDWSPAVNSQAEDRLHRIGQKGTVNIWIPYVVGGIEALIHKKLQLKQENADAALAGLTMKDIREAL